jgi:ring-1,2-phenylacetyl-CoA epoxidase subunit PaaD
MSATTSPPSLDLVRRAVASIDDPEHPAISIAELGLVVDVRVRGARVEVDLVPTYGGCPALAMIAGDVRAAVGSLPGVDDVIVTWLDDVTWTPDRVSPAARRSLAREYSVTLRRGDGRLACPVCGSSAVTDTSEAGPTRCRSLAWCPDCRNPVEVLR